MRKGMNPYLMNVVLVAAVAMSMAGTVQAQDEAYLALLRADVQANKTAIMTEAMMLTDEQGAAFWPIYREYLAELSKIKDKHLEMIKEYAANFDTLSDDKAKDIAKTWFNLKKKQLSLLEKTHKKVSKELNPGIASRFVQVDNVLNMFINLQIASQMPLFPDSTPGE